MIVNLLDIAHVPLDSSDDIAGRLFTLEAHLDSDQFVHGLQSLLLVDENLCYDIQLITDIFDLP